MCDEFIFFKRQNKNKALRESRVLASGGYPNDQVRKIGLEIFNQFSPVKVIMGSSDMDPMPLKLILGIISFKVINYPILIQNTIMLRE